MGGGGMSGSVVCCWITLCYRLEWLIDGNVNYTHRRYIYSQLSIPLFDSFRTRYINIYSSHNILHKVIPLKISLFACRLFQNRIPTSNNLLWRGLLQNQQQFCGYGCGSNEDINNLFCIVTFLDQFDFWFLIG